MKSFQINIITGLILIPVLLSCRQETEKNKAVDTTREVSDTIRVSKLQFTSAGMEFGALTTQSLGTALSVRGYIDVPPEGKAVVSTFYSGYIKDINLLPGQKVKRGELLFTLRNPDYIIMQQDYLESRDKLIYLRADYERQQTLARERIASQKNFKKAESEYKVMLAKNKAMKEQLKLMNIPISSLEKGQLTSVIPVYAPIGGFITKMNAVKNAFIDASEVALEIVNTDHIHLELQVFEKDVMQLKEGQTIKFTVPESADQVFEGKIHLIGRSVDSEQRTVNVHGHISEEDEEKFIPGMFVEAEVEVSGDFARCLPASALVETDGISYVLIKTKERGEVFDLLKQEVTVSSRSNEWVKISQPETLEGKEVLIKGAFALAGE